MKVGQPMEMKKNADCQNIMVREYLFSLESVIGSPGKFPSRL
jgi:hypothetical protein